MWLFKLILWIAYIISFYFSYKLLGKKLLRNDIYWKTRASKREKIVTYVFVSIPFTIITSLQLWALYKVFTTSIGIQMIKVTFALLIIAAFLAIIKWLVMNGKSKIREFKLAWERRKIERKLS